MVVMVTGIPLMDDMEEPLISRDVRQGQEIEDEESFEIDDEIVEEIHHYFLIMGWTLGFLLQCISLGSVAAMALYWENPPSAEHSTLEQLLYWTMSGLSNSWLLLFPVVCIGMERSWKEPGIRFMLTQVVAMDEPIVTKQARRLTFVASVRFLMGVVLGCFLTWGFIDMYLHASSAMLWALCFSMAACLVLCQGMIVIYDNFVS